MTNDVIEIGQFLIGVWGESFDIDKLFGIGNVWTFKGY